MYLTVTVSLHNVARITSRALSRCLRAATRNSDKSPRQEKKEDLRLSRLHQRLNTCGMFRSKIIFQRSYSLRLLNNCLHNVTRTHLAS